MNDLIGLPPKQPDEANALQIEYQQYYIKKFGKGTWKYVVAACQEFNVLETRKHLKITRYSPEFPFLNFPRYTAIVLLVLNRRVEKLISIFFAACETDQVKSDMPTFRKFVRRTARHMLPPLEVYYGNIKFQRLVLAERNRMVHSSKRRRRQCI